MLNWKDITIEKLQEIGELDDSFNYIEKKAHVVAILTGTPYYEIEKWTIAQLNKVDISFLDDMPKSKFTFKFKHKGKRYRLVKNAKDMKAHHFIELQELYKRDTLQALNEIIGCLSYRVNIFGRRIEDDYDEKVNDFKTLPVVSFYNYALFFSALYPKLLKATQIYLKEKVTEVQTRLDGLA